MKTIIAMTREMGSLGKDVAARIGERTGRRVVYHEIIDQTADKQRVRRSHVIRLLEKGASLWESLTADVTSASIYTADETYRLLASDDIVVIRGWGAVHLLQGIPHVVRVRVCAPIELRVQRMMERVGSDDRHAVLREVETADEAHTAIARRHFHVDWRQSEHYDTVLSTERMSVDECADELERTLALPRFQPTAASEQLVRSRALEWSIRAALRRNPRTAGARLVISCDGGRVSLSGCTENEEQSRLVPEVVAAVPGVTAVHVESATLPSVAALRAELDHRRRAPARGVRMHASA